MFDIQKQIRRLYGSSIAGSLSLTGAWVAILAARGYSLPQIGFMEMIFHLTSILFELPSGVLADVFGRKRMLMVSSLMQLTASLIMVCSNSLFLVCLSVAFNALSYNFASGSDTALAYDSLKQAGRSEDFEHYESNQLTIYRLCSGISTFCAGFALFLGYRIAYSTDIVMCCLQLWVLSGLTEIKPSQPGKIRDSIRSVVQESFRFVREAPRTAGLMLCNSLVGAFDILLLFFLQAKLPEKGIPTWLLGPALLFIPLGGIVGSRLILKLPKLRYRTVYALALGLVLLGLLAEHSGLYPVMVLGGFFAALGDDALQVRTNARLQDLFPSEQRATLTSLDSFLFSVIMIVLSPLAGLFFAVW